MKKLLGLALALCLMAQCLCPVAFAAPREIRVLLDGETISFDVQPMLLEGRTMVPLRAIFEALGADVQWDGKTQTVTATRDGVVVVASIGSLVMYVNGKPVYMDISPMLVSARTLVPARFIAEAFGCDVDWLHDTWTVVITSPPTGETPAPEIPAPEPSTPEPPTPEEPQPMEKPGGTIPPDWEDLPPVATPRHAPNMYVDWVAGKNYSSICVDWRCTQDATDTYWAVHNWDGGYAGFQNKAGSHVLLLSLWDLPNGTTPKVEYTLSNWSGGFGGEGTGKQVFTKYAWKVGTWYSMRVDMEYTGGKTIYTQYIRENGGDWLKTAAISYPCARAPFTGSSLFQEDFSFNNLQRSCELKNGCGKVASTGQWENWTKCVVSSSYFPTENATWENGVMENVTFDCNWVSNGETIFVQSGGEDFTWGLNDLPMTYTLKSTAKPVETPPASTPPANTPPANTPPASTPPASTPPASTPSTPTVSAITNGTYVIASKLNTNYVLDIDGAGISDGDNLQLWERNNTPAQTFRVTSLGGGFYRIVNTNSGKAIDAEYGGLDAGTNVWQYEVNDTPAQIWKIVPSGDGKSFFIINKESGLYLDVENAWADSGTNVQLFVRNDGYAAQNWIFIKQ